MPDDADRQLGWGALLGMGAAVAAILALGFGLGWLIDSLAHTAPLFMLVGLLLGVAAAASYTVVTFRRYLKD